jgi:hypothetical protein
MSSGVRNSALDLEGPIAPNDPGHLDTDEKRAPKSDIPYVYNDLDLVDETDLSIGAILKGTAAKPLTNFEKKAALINA